MNEAVTALSALAQESRLKLFRLLVECGPDGMAAGDIARRLGIAHNTLSAHLAILSRAGLAQSRREGRSIIYMADMGGTRTLLQFLVQDCCRGRAELCEPLLGALLPACCN